MPSIFGHGIPHCLVFFFAATALALQHIMRIHLGTLISVTSFACIVSSQKQDDSSTVLEWHAPNSTLVNSLSSAVNGTGVYDFIFNTSQTPDSEYGTYNWCNMPHVRRQEYVQPSPEYQLQYVEIIHRHHKRTPYASNSFPVEPYPWDCDDEGLFYYGQPLPAHQHQATAHPYWKVQTSSTNPFTASGFAGSCDFPQITSAGLDDSRQHGVDLRGVYHDLLDFLPASFSNETMTFRVTNNVITSQVVGELLAGMFSSSENSPIPVLVQPPTIDSLEPTYPCPAADALLSRIQDPSDSSSLWAQHLNLSQPLFQTLDRISGVSPTDSGWHSSLDHYFDNLSARLCHQKPLPCNSSSLPSSSPFPPLPSCISSSNANRVFRLGEWEYSFTYRSSPFSLTYSTARFGVFLAELAQHIRDCIPSLASSSSSLPSSAPASNIRYRHNVAHDGSVAPLLGMLQVEEMVWPGMGAELAFEVWSKRAGGSFLRVLWGGRSLRSSDPSLGVLDMVPAEKFLAYVDGLVGEGAGRMVELCATNSTTTATPA